MSIKSLSIRIDSNLLDNLHSVASYEGRSANSQIIFLIRNCVEQFEEKYQTLNKDKDYKNLEKIKL